MVSTQPHYLVVDGRELDVILEALWEFKRQQQHLRPAAAPFVDRLRRRLLRDSIVRGELADLAGWGQAQAPEST